MSGHIASGGIDEGRAGVIRVTFYLFSLIIISEVTIHDTKSQKYLVSFSVLDH